MNTTGMIMLQAQGGANSWSGMLMIVAMIVIFYFFMIRPQSKKQKEIKQAREAMKKGDKVVTAGGIHGTIREDKGNTILLEVAPNTSILVDKNSIYPIGTDEKAVK
ncbi:MAG: preprotein translocase subunit YajC [Bacteroidales bacterium]|nr:preprotein translocase subunit YajC [Bacteroidales bacterium]MBD5190421.1 preprotein translocase subunit YajC [Bacteroidales bacterium]MBD5209194.1 preprotein translocase subunit YajC [Bacteroidales bacterium]MDE6084031.1 preprotein translocase subunit YajC [Muribaculaceae bacterium]